MIFIADIPASSSQQINFVQADVRRQAPMLIVEPENGGVNLTYSNQPVGRLRWELVAHPVPAVKGETNEPVDFDGGFTPLRLNFHRTAHGPVFDRWQAVIQQTGLQLELDLMAYSDGFLDISGTFTNLSVEPKTKYYAAVVCRWAQPPAESRTLCYDNHILDLGERGFSPNRMTKGSETFKQRGTDWVRTIFKGGVTAAWLNDFAPSFTIIDNSTNNALHAPRYALANLSQLGQETQAVPERLYLVTEMARSDTRVFNDRLTENVLPLRGEGVTFGSRLVFSAASADTNEIDHALVASAGYNAQSDGRGGTEYSIGVPFVRFGTSYFPYSTLGENFDDEKLPGMDSESFWPLAADTVLQWRLFADDIRRDLRIAKAMGFQVIRFHHLELLGAIPETTRREYLDFLFGQLRELDLRALIDIYASPERLAEIAGRYRDLIDGVELENEIMIWGIPLDRPAQWKADYAAVKRVAPEIPLSLCGYNNTGMFNRLVQLGVPFDRVDLHSYIDSVEAIPSGRGYALALGSIATRLAKPPIITEWNWRGLTRMSEEGRARIYRPIIENAVATRAVSEFYQFQFNETLAPNPRLGRGNLLRHYELLALSRRPKLEALEFMKLIERYSAPDDGVRILRSSHEVVEVSAPQQARVNFAITNDGSAALRLQATVEAPPGLTAQLLTNDAVTLAPGARAVVPVSLTVTNQEPGFYHLFVRLESAGKLARYLWAEVRVPGAPRLEPGADVKFDFTRPVTVAYGPKATVLEVETAFAIGETLESATGRVTPIVPLEEIPGAAAKHLIFVGADRDLPQATGADWLVIGGKNSREVEKAGMQFVLHYWKFAKDSAARRVGLVQKSLPRGGDASKLP